MTDLIQQRITKYLRDLDSHPAASQPDGMCRCYQCHDARVILKELEYLAMVTRYLAHRNSAAPIAGQSEGQT